MFPNHLCQVTATDRTQMVVPQMYFMLKELRIEASMAYHDKDFKETVEAFVAGEL
jgi:hypothetical protein